MSMEEAILFNASVFLQYAIINVNAFKLREWLDLADCFVVCVLCNYQHSSQTGMSNFSSSQQADYKDGIMSWVKLTGAGEWNGCPSVMSKCNRHGARQIKKGRGKKGLFDTWAGIWTAHRRVENRELCWAFPGYCLTVCTELSSMSKQKVKEVLETANWSYTGNML